MFGFGIGRSLGIGGSASAISGEAVDYLSSIAAKIGGGDAWTFDEETGDLVGVVNGTILVDGGTASIAGIIGNARAGLNGTYLGADSTGVALFPTANATVFAWISAGGSLGDPPAASVGAAAVMLDSDDGGLIYIYGLYRDDGKYYVYAECTTDTGTVQSTAEYEVTGGVLTCVAVVRTAAGFAFHVNNINREFVPIATGETYPNVVGDFAYFTSANQNIPLGRFGSSQCDEVLIVHEALTDDELDWLYNDGAGRSMSEFAP